jgi:hypothetical protein
MTRRASACFALRLISHVSNRTKRFGRVGTRPLIPCTCLLALLFAMQSASAQVQPGIPPFSTVQTRGIDTINVASGNILLRNPIRTKAAGPIPFVFFLSMNPSAQCCGYPTQWIINPQFNSSSNLSGSVSNARTPDTCDNGYNTTVLHDWTFKDVNGTIHPFNITVDTRGCLDGKTATGVSTDGSGHTLSRERCVCFRSIRLSREPNLPQY